MSGSGNLRLSLLDLAPIPRGGSAGESLGNSVALARRAEELGYLRVWYAEHHNMPTIASSATSVLIAHVAAHTSRIRVGAGGIMLPNHAPLTIAEQFGTLAELHPGRIDLGLGRAPGADRGTTMALRRQLGFEERFPDDVLELQGYLGEHSLVPGVEATPGKGTGVPIFILGSSMYGASLAAALGLPYAFASQFAPAVLEEAVAAYRAEFRPSPQLDRPYVIAGFNVVAADTEELAQAQFREALCNRIVSMASRQGGWQRELDPDELLDSPLGRQVRQMLSCVAVGTVEQVARATLDFRRRADADELITVHHAPRLQERLRSLELLAQAVPQGVG